jgi:hypothetical protein
MRYEKKSWAAFSGSVMADCDFIYSSNLVAAVDFA